MGHDSFLCGTWLMSVGHDSCLCWTWLNSMWDMTDVYVGHDSCLCGTWLMSMLDMTDVYVGHRSCLFFTWFISMCDMTMWHTHTHVYVGHDSCLCGTWLISIWDMIFFEMCMSHVARRADPVPCATSLTPSHVKQDSGVAWHIMNIPGKWWYMYRVVKTQRMSYLYRSFP